MTKIKIGKIMPTPKGAYNPNVQYETLDIVFCDGCSYIASQDVIAEHPCTSDKWELMAQRGLNGEGGGGTDNTYIHDQSVASATWTINHNLNKFPSITIIDSSGNVVMGDIQYISPNTVILSFRSEFSGKAYLN